MGHVHLKVSSTAETISFYHDVLGFALMAQLGSHAAFLSAGGYHHHIGANTWESAGASAAPRGTVRLRHATIVLPHDTARRPVLDRLIRSGHSAAGHRGGANSRGSVRQLAPFGYCPLSSSNRQRHEHLRTPSAAAVPCLREERSPAIARSKPANRRAVSPLPCPFYKASDSTVAGVARIRWVKSGSRVGSA